MEEGIRPHRVVLTPPGGSIRQCLKHRDAAVGKAPDYTGYRMDWRIGLRIVAGDAGSKMAPQEWANRWGHSTESHQRIGLTAPRWQRSGGVDMAAWVHMANLWDVGCCSRYYPRRNDRTAVGTATPADTRAGMVWDCIAARYMMNARRVVVLTVAAHDPLPPCPVFSMFHCPARAPDRWMLRPHGKR